MDRHDSSARLRVEEGEDRRRVEVVHPRLDDAPAGEA
jgi:hypothetical protein